jgi:hypothetical protein
MRIVTIQQIDVTNCTFRENQAISLGGAVVCGNPGQRTFKNCTFFRNTATDPATDGGAGLVLMDGTDSVLNCQFIQNQSARIGGGLWINRGDHVTVNSCTFWGNSAGDRAGGMAVSRDAQATLTNSVFVGNVSGLASGMGVSALDAFDGLGGPAQVIMTGCTFVHNVAPPGFAAIGAWTTSTIAARNCIFLDNNPHAFIDNGLTVLTYSCFGLPPAPTGDGNIAADPLFVRYPDNGGDDWGNANDDFGDLRLTAASPCIDSGDPTFLPDPCEHDLAGACRLWDGDADSDVRVDMGAYEFAAALGDIDGDCQIALGDLAVLLSHYGTPSGALYADGDVDGDGDVDLNDLALLLASYGTTCP